jgi:hypothetical protein
MLFQGIVGICSIAGKSGIGAIFSVQVLRFAHPIKDTETIDIICQPPKELV